MKSLIIFSNETERGICGSPPALGAGHTGSTPVALTIFSCVCVVVWCILVDVQSRILALLWS